MSVQSSVATTNNTMLGSKLATLPSAVTQPHVSSKARHYLTTKMDTAIHTHFTLSAIKWYFQALFMLFVCHRYSNIS